MTKEELKDTKIWFGDNAGLRDRIYFKIREILSGETIYWNEAWTKYSSIPTDLNDDNMTYYFLQGYKLYRESNGFEDKRQKEITPSQLLGETEEWKIGDYVFVIDAEDGAKGANKKVGKLTFKGATQGLSRDYGYKIDIGGNVWNVGKNAKLRLARPEEIPQEEVEYVECLNDHYGQFTKGKIYQLQAKKEDGYGRYNVTMDDKGSTTNGWGKNNFKPSTREAYEAQQAPIFVDCEDCSGTGKTIEGVLLPTGHSERSIDCPTCKGQGEIKNVNKCSTINTNQNECKNENSKRVITIGKVLETPRGERPRGSILPIGKRMYPSASRRK